MEILILSKTRIGSNACIGGIVVDTNQYVRLMNGRNTYQPGNSPFNVGQVWDIEFQNDPDRAPHIEDVNVVRRANTNRTIEINKYIRKKASEGEIQIWDGGPNTLFEGNLNFLDNLSGYIDPTRIPNQSVGFWLLNQDLNLYTTNYFGKIKHRYSNAEIDMSYIGFAQPIQNIPAGTLLRVSLAKWFTPNNRPYGCYLQLSGWY